MVYVLYILIAVYSYKVFSILFKTFRRKGREGKTGQRRIKRRVSSSIMSEVANLAGIGIYNLAALKKINIQLQATQ